MWERIEETGGKKLKVLKGYKKEIMWVRELFNVKERKEGKESE
jgi:hypothetical protein